MIKAAILYICTGKYDVFWKDFLRVMKGIFYQIHGKNILCLRMLTNYIRKTNATEFIKYTRNDWDGLMIH